MLPNLLDVNLDDPLALVSQVVLSQCRARSFGLLAKVSSTKTTLEKHRIFLEKGVGNPGLLRSLGLDLIGCMHLSLGFSRSNTMKNNDFKNHYRLKI